jgi:hypothetical protein
MRSVTKLAQFYVQYIQAFSIDPNWITDLQQVAFNAFGNIYQGKIDKRFVKVFKINLDEKNEYEQFMLSLITLWYVNLTN